MNKVIITMISIVVILSAVIFGSVIYKKQIATKDNEQYETKKVGDTKNSENEKIYDECTEEYNKIENLNTTNTLQANSGEVKISPNGMFVLKKKYTKCGHLINEYIDIPNEVVNKTEDNLKEQYKDWEIHEFSSNKVVLYKEYNEECGQHYILREKEGKIVVNKINKEGIEEVYQETDIAIVYLTPTDKANIEKGLKVYGKEELNQTIEDFE